jgi:hypothetical protein
MLLLNLRKRVISLKFRNSTSVVPRVVRKKVIAIYNFMAHWGGRSTTGERGHSTHLIGGWVGHISSLHAVEK